MGKGARLSIVAIVFLAGVLLTFWESKFEGDELILNINLWGLISLAVVAVLGVWFVRKAR